MLDNLQMTREEAQTNLRLPVALKDRLSGIAQANNRSLSAEVAHRLEASLTEDLQKNVREAKAEATALLARGEMLGLRADMLHSRAENINIRCLFLSSQVEILSLSANDAAAIATLKEKIEELAEVSAQTGPLLREARRLTVEQEGVMARFHALMGTLAGVGQPATLDGATTALESSLADYFTRLQSK